MIEKLYHLIQIQPNNRFMSMLGIVKYNDYKRYTKIRNIIVKDDMSMVNLPCLCGQNICSTNVLTY